MPDKFFIPVKLVELDNQSFHLLIEARINDISLNLIIDTGASRTVFDKKILEGCFNGHEMELQNIQSAGIMADQIESKMAIADVFRIGNLELNKYPVIMIDLEAINKLYLKVAGEKIHGLLGSDFLLKMRAIIDYEKLVLILRKSE
jgi:hypothetical protein